MNLEFDEAGNIIVPNGLGEIKPFYSEKDIIASIRGCVDGVCV